MIGLDSVSQVHKVTTSEQVSEGVFPSAGGVIQQENLVTSFKGFFSQPKQEETMVYVQRDAQGRLLRVEYQPFEGMSENLSVESEELHNWLAVKEQVKARLDALNSSDLELIRVLEDVIIVLVDRGVIQYTDLPEAARNKLDERAIARADMEGLNSMLKDS